MGSFIHSVEKNPVLLGSVEIPLLIAATEAFTPKLCLIIVLSFKPHTILVDGTISIVIVLSWR